MREAPGPDDAAKAFDILGHGRLFVLGGAGLSTDSGIPDYRGPGAPARTPMTYQEFVSGPEAQRRYWARAAIGWGRMGGAQPNAGHHALVDLERQGRVELLVTQNVDGLHEAAGSRSLVALHGRVADVLCLDCRAVTRRADLQARVERANATYLARHSRATLNPDGDVEVDDTADFHTPACLDCGGRLKPDVVFFGENVPKPRVERCHTALERSDAVLAVGSSLAVMSGFRFVRAAARAGLPIVIVNRGETRGDDLASVKVEAGCAEFLTELAASEATSQTPPLPATRGHAVAGAGGLKPS